MKAVAVDAHGDLDQVSVSDVDDPEAGPDEVRIKVAAASLNHLDLFTIAGIPGLKLRMPHVLGSDGAGVIDEVGRDVEGWDVGARVTYNPGLFCGRCGACIAGQQSLCNTYRIIGEHVPGAMAEYVVVPARNLVELPDGFPFESAAAASLVYQTAWRMAITKARLTPGMSCLVLGAGSGLSTALIQIAAMAGCTVYATTSTPEKMEWAKETGAHHVFNYRDADWSKQVFVATGKKGVDAVFDSVGRETINDSIRSVKKGGRIVVPGGTTGTRAEIDLRFVFWKQVEILGSTMGTQVEYEDVMRLVFAGRLEPRISATLPLHEAGKAFAMLKAGRQFGKIVLTV